MKDEHKQMKHDIVALKSELDDERRAHRDACELHAREVGMQSLGADAARFSPSASPIRSVGLNEVPLRRGVAQMAGFMTEVVSVKAAADEDARRRRSSPPCRARAGHIQMRAAAAASRAHTPV
jgi:hypothetical protein